MTPAREGVARGDDRPRILLTGASGQIGGRLRAELTALGEVIAPARGELDLSDAAALRDAVRRVRPRVVVNAAAYTAVDAAEADVEAAFAVNATAPGVLAEAARRERALLVHYSTDYVFDGRKREPYEEDDAPAPLNVYGASKRAGEEAVLEVGGDFRVLRTSWIYDVRGKNFLLTMLRLMREREEVRVVSDQVGAPTWARDVASVTARLVGSWLGSGGEGRSGIYHASASGETTWYGFAAAIRELDPHAGEQLCRSLTPIPTRDFPTPAERPRYSVLSSRRLAATWGVELPHWREGVVAALAEMDPRPRSP